MPRQTANGQPQDSTLMFHARGHQPIAAGLVTVHHTLLQGMSRCRPATRLRPTAARWVQVENGQARITALGLPGREEATAVGEGQEIAHLGVLPTAVGNPRRQYLAEQNCGPWTAAASAHCVAPAVPYARPSHGRQPHCRCEAETLRTKSWGNALTGDQARARRWPRGRRSVG